MKKFLERFKILTVIYKYAPKDVLILHVSLYLFVIGGIIEALRYHSFFLAGVCGMTFSYLFRDSKEIYELIKKKEHLTKLQQLLKGEAQNMQNETMKKIFELSVGNKLEKKKDKRLLN